MPLVGADAIRQHFEAFAGAARAPDPADRIGGLLPGLVLEPADRAAAAAMLAAANAARLAVVPRGSGTKITWGARPGRADVILSTLQLNDTIDHEAGDLVASVPAGATLRQVNAVLAQAGQWIPLDPFGSTQATIGGIVAAHDSGPRRHKHGAPRDLLIGIEFVLANGRIARAGGRVVKNVAGYDLGRLLCGSFGTLALITRATFKLSPLPSASRTVRARWRPGHGARGHAPLQQALAELAVAPLTASAVELLWPELILLVRFETTRGAAARQSDSAAAILERCGAAVDLLHDSDEAAAWGELDARVRPERPATVIKVAALPGLLLESIDAALDGADRHGLEIRGTAHAAAGVVYARVDGPPNAVAAGLREMRQAAAARQGTLALLTTAADEIRDGIDPWGDVGDAAGLMRAVKAQFDPFATLSPGRGAAGF